MKETRRGEPEEATNVHMTMKEEDHGECGEIHSRDDRNPFAPKQMIW